MATLYVINSPILTDYGVYEYREVELEKIKDLLSKRNFVSAIGHQATADLVSTLTGVDVPMNRIQIKMSTGDAAVVVKLKTRLEEGRVLDIDELTEMYNRGLIEFGILYKKS